MRLACNARSRTSSVRWLRMNSRVCWLISTTSIVSASCGRHARHPHVHDGTWWIVDNSVHTSPHGETVDIGGFVYNFVDNLGHYPPVIPTLSPTYPHGYPQIVENYTGVVYRSLLIEGTVSIFAQLLL